MFIFLLKCFIYSPKRLYPLLSWPHPPETGGQLQFSDRFPAHPVGMPSPPPLADSHVPAGWLSPGFSSADEPSAPPRHPACPQARPNPCHSCPPQSLLSLVSFDIISWCHGCLGFPKYYMCFHIFPQTCLEPSETITIFLFAFFTVGLANLFTLITSEEGKHTYSQGLI